MKQILVLGGTGAMGTPLVEILSRNFHVSVTSRQERHSSSQNVSYIVGNAKDISFIKNVLAMHQWDAVIDFMVYSTEEFRSRAHILLSGTNHYVFISSARVYSRSEVPITEDTPRLLDTCDDSDYLKTDEYALTKARQEDILRRSGKTNWTIIRPSITYNDKRLQLGVLEKEGWLYRALHGRSIVFSKDIADKPTTMTWGYNVAEGIASITARPEAMSQVFHIITEPNAYLWQEILDVYLDVLTQKLGKRPRVIMTDKSTNFKFGNKYQIIYCRYFNRKFDNTRISRFIDEGAFVDAKDGLRKCLEKFLEQPSFGSINWRLEAVNDSVSGERARLSEIHGKKAKAEYILCRYNLEFVMKIIRRLKNMTHKISNLCKRGGGNYLEECASNYLVLGSGVSSPKNISELKPVIFAALENGIRRFDTAPSYGTENTLGEILKLAENELGVSRESYSVQTKIDAWQMVEGNIRKHVDDALKKLGAEYLDSLLIHWPVPEEMSSTWSQMAGLKNSGLVRRIGICNVRMRQLKHIADYDVKPDVIQIERSPLRTCDEELEFCRKNHIELQAYSPLCKMHHTLRDSETVRRISEHHNRTMGQVIMRWHIDTGAVPIFATHRPERIREYCGIFGFSLNDEEVSSISSLNCNHKMYLESFACPGF